MSLLFFAGFESGDAVDYTNIDIITTSNLLRSSTFAKTGVYSGSVSSAQPNIEIKSQLTSEITYVVGAAFYIKTGFTSISAGIHFNLGGSSQTSVILDYITSSKIKVYRNLTGTLLATGTASIIKDTWYYIEAKVTVHDSTGSVIINVDNVEDINISGVDTQQTSSGVDSIRVGSLTNCNNANFIYIDDVYICDTLGSINNDFLGPVKVERISPSGNGYNSDFVGSDADSTDNYLHVDEISDDGDTSYVQSDVVSDIDSFEYGNLTGDIGTVHGVALHSFAKKQDTLSRNFKQFVRVSGTNYLSAEYTPVTSYQPFFDIWEENPNTATGWSESDVNAIEAGIEISS